jgi:hypothetical protein
MGNEILIYKNLNVINPQLPPKSAIKIPAIMAEPIVLETIGPIACINK